MRFNKPTRIVAAIAVIGAVAAGGAAFTAGNTVPASVAGYGQANVTGGVVDNLTYGFSSDGTTVTSATIAFLGNTISDTAEIGFNGTSGTAVALQTCNPGTAGSDANGVTTVYSCPLTGLTVTTANVSQADIVLTNNAQVGS
jgi:hypothetical protein